MFKISQHQRQLEKLHQQAFWPGQLSRCDLSLLLQLWSRLQKVKTRKLQLAGTGERLMISNSYNRHNARSPVPARKNLLFAGDSL